MRWVDVLTMAGHQGLDRVVSTETSCGAGQLPPCRVGQGPVGGIVARRAICWAGRS